MDGLGIGAIQDVVLRDRRQLSADGTLVVVCQLHEDGNGAGSAEVIARGFAPEGAEEAETLLADVLFPGWLPIEHIQTSPAL